MATIKFYEKTGCINNTKQKEILTLAGHQVEAINLLHYHWTADKLLSFFSELPVKEWFNKNAPSIQKGETDVNSFTKETALAALLSDKLLIRRPLLEINGQKFVGFDNDALDAFIGLKRFTTPKLDQLLNQNLNDCPQKDRNMSCD